MTVEGNKMKINSNSVYISFIEASYQIEPEIFMAQENRGQKTKLTNNRKVFVEYEYKRDCRKCKLLRLFLFYCSIKCKKIKVKVTIENKIRIIGKAKVEVIEETHNMMRIRLTFSDKYKIKQ